MCLHLVANHVTDIIHFVADVYVVWQIGESESTDKSPRRTCSSAISESYLFFPFDLVIRKTVPFLFIVYIQSVTYYELRYSYST